MEFTPFCRSAVLLFALVSTLSGQSLKLEEVARLPRPVVDAASDDAQRALQHFRLPAGFGAKLWAAEPMLANPVAIAFDEKGRLFVSETHRYRTSVLDIRSYLGAVEVDLASRTIEDRVAMIHKVFGDEQAKQLAIESEVVRLVEDRDGDGVAETSSIYADGFNSELDGIASGLLARNGKVWFTNIPSLWLLENDPSGKAPSKRTELLRGFGVRFNFTGHDLHGLILGHDGKLYFSIGDRGAHVSGKEGQTVDVPDEGAIFRCNLDGTEFELFAHGLRNPQELAFDEHGNLFTGDNDSDNGDLERLVYLVEGGDSGWRVGYQHGPLGKANPWLREGLWKPRFAGQPANSLPPICNIEDGPSGLAYYPGTGLSPEYQGHFFITHFKGSITRSGIQTYTIRPDGAGFACTGSDLFMGGILATDVTFGPDGTLYVADWVAGWPKSQKGRIYGITPLKIDSAQKAVSAELARFLAAGFSGLDVSTLRGLLAHPDRRARLEAQLELAARGKGSIATFREVAIDPVAAPLARLHAVWGLTQLGRKQAEVPEILLRLLNDSDAEVRAQAAKGLGDLGHAAAVQPLIKKLQDAAPRVQFFAAQSLGKLKRADASEALIDLLRRNADIDVYLRHAAVFALSRLGKTPALEAATLDQSAAVRLGALLIFRLLKEPSIARFLDDKDPYLAREAAIAINDAPVTAAYPALATKLATLPDSEEPSVLRAINANFRVGGAENAQALARFAGRSEISESHRAEALIQLGLWANVPARDRLVGVYRPLSPREAKIAAEALSPVTAEILRAAPDLVRSAALSAISDLQLRSAAPELLALIGNENASGETRAKALNLLDRFEGAENSRGTDLAAKSSVTELRLAALQILARRSPAQALPVIRRLAVEGTEAEQQAAFSALSRLDLPETPQLLLLGLDRLTAGQISPGAQFELLDAVEKSPDAQVRTRWTKVKADWAAGPDVLAPYRGALTGGDSLRGRRIFMEHPVLACIRCHKVYGEGGEAGPDLAGISAKKTPEYLLESVIKPNAKIAEGFDLVTLQLKGGKSEAGAVVRESPTEIVLKHTDGSEVTVDPKLVSERQAAPSSMPEIYGQVLTRGELRDLIAFLKTLDRVPTRRVQVPRALAATATAGDAGGHP